MSPWKAAGIAFEGTPIDIEGVNPWNFKWLKAGPPPVQLPHPSHPNELHHMHVYRIHADGKDIVFAAGELSAGVFGFYTQE